VARPERQRTLASLEDPKINWSIKLLSIPLHDRPEFFAQLIPNLQDARPHGPAALAGVDEALHMLSDTCEQAGLVLPQVLGERCACSPILASARPMSTADLMF
jgi:hypothetical protein